MRHVDPRTDATADVLEDLQYRYESACRDFHNRIDSEHVFVARLKGLGYNNNEIRTEVYLNAPPMLLLPPPRYTVCGGTVVPTEGK